MIFDTTLRDGEQAPGIALTPEEKVTIAHQLARLRVDVLEAGFAASSPGDFEAVSRIAADVKGPVIASLARAHPDDIDRSYDALKDAERFRIHVFMSTSPIHMEKMLRMTPEEVFRRRSSKASAAPRSTPTTSSFRPRTRLAPTPTS